MTCSQVKTPIRVRTSFPETVLDSLSERLVSGDPGGEDEDVETIHVGMTTALTQI